MAKNFGAAASAKTIKEVAKTSNSTANVIRVIMVGNEHLHDYKNNRENIEYTADLENSIDQCGFTDPIEITSFGMEEGEYTIVSGHRRRAAGVKKGIEVFPCIVRRFDNKDDLHNYVLLANSQRDSSKDPLLFCARYKMHEEYLLDTGFKGSVREEVAKRLGISAQQSDRYNQFNKVILPIWDMVRAEKLGMSSVLGMSSHTEDEQLETLSIFNECLTSGGKLTRDMCDKIIKGYRSGKKTFAEIIEVEEQTEDKPVQPTQRDSGLPLNGFINTEPSKTREPADLERNRNGEMRREYDPDTYDDDNNHENEHLAEEDYTKNLPDNKDSEADKKGDKKPPLSEGEKKTQSGISICKHFEALKKGFDEPYVFNDIAIAEQCMNTMNDVIRVAVEEMQQIGKRYGKEDIFNSFIKDLKDDMELYK